MHTIFYGKNLAVRLSQVHPFSKFALLPQVWKTPKMEIFALWQPFYLVFTPLSIIYSIRQCSENISLCSRMSARQQSTVPQLGNSFWNFLINKYFGFIPLLKQRRNVLNPDIPLNYTADDFHLQTVIQRNSFE